MSLHEEIDHATVERIVRQAIEDVRPEDIESPALKRLLEDIQESDSKPATPQLYNRMYNRHNRSR